MSRLSMLDERISGTDKQPENPFEVEKFNCEICKDEGFWEKTEWTGTDDSYDVEVKCECQED